MAESYVVLPLAPQEPTYGPPPLTCRSHAY